MIGFSSAIRVICPAALALAGCAGGHIESARSRLNNPDFFAQGARSAPPEPAEAASKSPAANARPPIVGEVIASGGIADDAAVANPGPPPAASPDGPAKPVGDAQLVDAKVGEVNGRGIYARAFLEPMAARLFAESQRRKLDDWRRFAAGEIVRELRALLSDELLRSEALAGLSTEQKQGFFAYMESIQRDYQRKRGGSREVAEESLQQTEGLTLDEWRQRRGDEELVRLQLEQRITRRVNVVLRDIRQRYDQLYDEYNKPDIAVFRLVQVLGSKPADVEAVRAKVLAGEPFEKIASLPANINRREQAGLEEREIKPTADGSPQELFKNPSLNAAAHSLLENFAGKPQASEAVSLGSSTAWLVLEDVRVRSRSFYDAQLELETRVRQERIQQERLAYMGLLQNQASITSFEEMVIRLGEVAEAWYYQPAQPKPAANAGGR
jgi:hypothetical protein